jgi:hypothetical protein
MFLLLCIPQLQDWQTRWCNGHQSTGNAELGLYAIVVGVLWLNGEWPFGIGLPRASSDAQLDLVLRYELLAYVSLFAQLEFRR